MSQTAMPTWLNQVPPRSIQNYLLLTLLWVVVPILVHMPLMVGFTFAILWLVRLLTLMQGIQTLPRWLVLSLAVVAVIVTYINLGTVVGREGGSALLVLLIMLKTFESKAMRDWHLLLLVQLLVMGVVLLFDQSILMALWLCLALFFLVSALGWLSGISIAAACRQAGLILVLSVPLAIVLFMLVPRRDTPLWYIPQTDQTIAKTGLSDTLATGSISQLIEDNELVFNASFTTQQQLQSKDLYWRVMIMGQNQDGVWHALDEEITDGPLPWVAANMQNSSAKASPLWQYQLFLKDDHGKIPALDYPVTAQQPELRWLLGDVVQVRQSREGWRRINLQSHLTDRLPDRLSINEQRFFTALPVDKNRQTRALAVQLAKKSHGYEDFIQRVLTYFKQGDFVYTLTPKRSLDKEDHTDFFLFNSREGFCEDYADAMVWIARAVGLPARIVVGYQGAEYHADGQFWQVRSKDAHAWTEIWLPDQQVWLRIDPTAAIATERIQAGINQALPSAQRAALQSSVPWLSKIAQNSQFYWQRWVVNYDNTNQRSIFHWFRASWFSSLLLLLILILVLLPLWLWIKQQKTIRISPLMQGRLLLGQAVGIDEATLVTMGTEEIRTALIEAEIITATLNHLLDQYSLWLYANDAMPSRQQQRQWLRQLKQALRQSTR